MKYTVFLTLLSALILVHLEGCVDPLTEEEKIGLLIEDVATAANQKKILPIMVRIADDYTDSMGRGKDVLRSQIFHTFKRYPKMHLQVREARITVNGDAASAEVNVAFQNRISVQADEPFTFQEAVLYTFSIELVNASDQWTILKGSWKKWGQ